MPVTVEARGTMQTEPTLPAVIVGPRDTTTVAEFFEHADAIGARVVSRDFVIRPADSIEDFEIVHDLGVMPRLVFIRCGGDGDLLVPGQAPWTETTLSLRTSADRALTVAVVGIV